MAITRIRESEEMYLETILLLHRTLSRGVNLLKDKGYIDIDPATGNITFTRVGKEKAEGIYERHRVLTSALRKMGAEEHIAEENACRIEHVVSDEMMDVFRRFISS